MKKITAIIPTLNEEANIEEAIKSVKFADEIIVIDSFSTDRTVELAKKHGVKAVQREFDDFSSQKNYAINLAKNDWIYILDADERITTALENELLKTVENPKGYVGFYVRRTFFFMGKRIKFSGHRRDRVVRLFLKNNCRYNGNLVHEVIKAEGKLGILKNRIDHFSYRNFDHYIVKLNRYAWLQAKQYNEKTGVLTPFHFVIKPMWRFFKHYIIQGGFRDGIPGMVISYLHSYAVFMRYVKIWLLRRNLK